jgi:hypothetical protein
MGIDSMWLFHGTGSPGNWDWQVFNVRQIGACSLMIADTLFYCYPSQFPNVSYEPISNTILISYKAFYLKATATDTFFTGAHIGGIYSTDYGLTWHISQPLSEANTGQIPWYDWSATEVAHRLVNINGDVYSYGIWADEVTLNFYFERGHVSQFYRTGIAEDRIAGSVPASLNVTPTVSSGIFNISFYTAQPKQVDIKLYDASGRFVKCLFNASMKKGNNTLQVKTTDLSTGAYFIVFNTRTSTQIEKITVISN